jgi:NodT family efflux transporter outer membrane factor (OMF) lipoprotein
LGDLDASNSFRAGLDASWEPDIFGGRRSALNATEADAKAFEASLGDAQVSVAAEVALAYIQLRGQQAQLGIARTNLASQQETLQITDWRAQAGLITSLEVEQARTAAEQTSAQIPTLETTIAKTRNALSVLTGQRPEALNMLLAESQPVPQAAIGLAQNIPAHTLRQRPDVRAAEHRISAALARVSVAQAARYPGFSISGSLGLNALTLGALTNGASVVNSLLGSVSVPLFDGGAAKSQVLAQEAVLEQARASYQAVVLTALKDVEDALAALKGDRTRQIHLQGAATAAGNADLLAQQRFKSGLIDFQTVLQTQRTLLTAQDSVASASADISADHVRLYKALGGGWN